jgi:hypothetical protein
MTTKEDIRAMIERAPENTTHMMIVCDTFDYGDYPVYVSTDEDIHEVITHYNREQMQRIMEVYNLSMDIDKQLSEHRAWHI